MASLKEIPCHYCGGDQVMQQLIYAARNIRRGWYCTKCTSFKRAVGRERLLGTRPTAH